MSGGLRLAPPLPDDAAMWKSLLNFLYLHHQDEYFRWLQAVRETVEECERQRERRAA